MTGRRQSWRTAIGVLLALTVAVLVLGDGTSMSAFTGSILNSSDTTHMTYLSCQAADLNNRPTRLYSLASGSGGTNLGSGGNGTNATFVGSNILTPGFGSGGGCKRDPQSYYVTTSGLLLGIAARWVSTAGTTSLVTGTVMTQEVWFQTSTKGGLLLGFGDSNGGVLGNGTSGTVAHQVFMTDTGQLDYATGTGSTKNEIVTPATKNYADGFWHQVTAVYNNGVKQLYVDGQPMGSATVTGQTANLYWRIGYDKITGWTNKSANSYFEGGLQWAGLYPVALSAAQVAAHYNAGVG